MRYRRTRLISPTYEEREKINKLGLEKFKLEEQEKALKGQAGNEQQLAAIKQQLTKRSSRNHENAR